MDQKLLTLTSDWGYDDPLDLLDDDLSPGICMNPDCDYSADMEPDQDQGWCENCETNSVKSAFLLLGVI